MSPSRAASRFSGVCSRWFHQSKSLQMIKSAALGVVEFYRALQMGTRRHWLAEMDQGDAERLRRAQQQLWIAAVLRQSLALLGDVLGSPEIAAGRLLQPFETRLPVKMNYHLVTSKHKAGIAKVAAFREWILAESAYLR